MVAITTPLNPFGTDTISAAAVEYSRLGESVQGVDVVSSCAVDLWSPTHHGGLVPFSYGAGLVQNRRLASMDSLSPHLLKPRRRKRGLRVRIYAFGKA